MLGEIDADRFQALHVELNHVFRRRLQNHLQLHVLVEPVGVVAIAPVRRATAGLDVNDVVRVRAQDAEERLGTHRAGADLHIERLLHNAALLGPIPFELQNDVLVGLHTDKKQAGNTPGTNS